MLRKKLINVTVEGFTRNEFDLAFFDVFYSRRDFVIPCFFD